MLRRKVLAQRNTLRQRDVGAEVSPCFKCNLELTVCEAERGEHQPACEYQTHCEPDKTPDVIAPQSVPTRLNTFRCPAPRNQHNGGEHYCVSKICHQQRMTRAVEQNGKQKC